MTEETRDQIREKISWLRERLEAEDEELAALKECRDATEADIAALEQALESAGS